MADFKDRLRELIKETNKTQKDIAKEISAESELEISPQTLSYYVNGREPNYETLKVFAKYFDVSVDYLVGYSNAERVENEDVIKELGLTNKVIALIKRIQSNLLLADDDRSLLDVFNQLVSQPLFLSFLAGFRRATFPGSKFVNFHFESISDYESYEIDDDDAKSIAYVTYLKSLLDEIIYDILIDERTRHSSKE